MKYLFSTLTLVVLLVFAGCKKEEASKEENTGTTGQYSLSTSQTLPMQLLVVASTDDIGAETQVATIAGQPVTLLNISDKEWGFLCPVLTPGAYSVKLDGKFELPFTVSAYAPITSPGETINALKTQVTALKSNIDKTTIDNKQELIASIDYLKAGLEEAEANLTVEEKTELAYYIHSNGYDQPAFSDVITTNIPDSFMGKSSLFDPTDAADRFIVGFVNARYNFGVSAGVSIALFLAPEPTFATKALGALAAVKAIADFSVIMHLIDNDLSKLFAKAADLQAFQKRAVTLEFKGGTPVPVGFKSAFHNFTAGDQAAGIFPGLFSGITEVNKKVTVFYDAYRKIKSWFSSSQPAANEKPLSVTTVKKEKTFYLNPKYLQVKSVSNPGIKVDLVANGTDVSLKASSSSVKQKTNFTITLKYNQANVNHSTEQTIDAVFEPGFDLTGTWNCVEGSVNGKNLFDYTDEWEVTCFEKDPPVKVKLVDVIKRDYLRWGFTSDKNVNWLEKGTDVRQTGSLDGNCNPTTPNTIQVNQNIACTYKMEGNMLKITAPNVDDGEETTWQFQQISNTEFRVEANFVETNFVLRFVKQ